MNNEFKEKRVEFLKSIFYGKNEKWINDNILYEFKLQLNDFKQILNALNTNKITINQFNKIFYWITYSYFTTLIVKNYIPKIILPINDSNTVGFVKYYIYHYPQNNIFVSFRGTKTFFEALSGIKFYRVPFLIFNEKDKKTFFQWRNNVIKLKTFNKYKIPQLDDLDIELHKGFLDEAASIYNNLVENLEKIIVDNKPINIVLCGHSLGGVLSHIIGIYLGFYMQDLVKNKKLSIHIISANSPPIGNKNFNLLIPYLGIKNFWRFYNYQDFVPHYGYLGSWIESKKFRHLDFMLENGISNSYNALGRKINTKINNTNIIVNDFGVNLDNFMEKIPQNTKLNNKYVFHDLFVIDPKQKSVFI